MLLKKIIGIIFKSIKCFFIILGILIVLWIIFITIKLKYFPSKNYKTSIDKYFEANEPKNWEVKKGAWIYYPPKNTYYRHGEKRNKVTGIVSTCGDNTDMFKSYRTKCIYQLDPVVYIGEWEYDKQIRKYIRLIKRQGLNDGEISKTYETMDERNKNIPAMKWSPVRKINDAFNFDNNPPEDIQHLFKPENDKVVVNLMTEGYIVADNNGKIMNDNKSINFINLEPEEIDKIVKLHERQK